MELKRVVVTGMGAITPSVRYFTDRSRSQNPICAALNYRWIFRASICKLQRQVAADEREYSVEESSKEPGLNTAATGLIRE